MKIHCPACNRAYNISEEKLSKPLVKAICKQCSTKMIIDRDSKTVKMLSSADSRISEETTELESSAEISGNVSKAPTSLDQESSESPPSQIPDSVISMSPKYPKHRDALIIGVVALFLVTVLAVAYLLLGHTQTAFREFTQNPINYLTRFINGYETYKVCESYLRRNQRLFRGLGRDLRFTVVKEEIRVLKGEKTARLLVKAKGHSGTQNILFQLRKRQGRWRIYYVGIELPDGTYQTLFPKQRS
jgi:hypothetical protein